MKATVQIWPLPPLTEKELQQLLSDILVACNKSPLKTRSEEEVVIGFNKDLMEYGLGTDLVIDVGYPYSNPDSEDDCFKTASEIGEAVAKFFRCLDHPGWHPNIQCQGRVIRWVKSLKG